MQAERTQACGTADATLREYGVFIPHPYTASIYRIHTLDKSFI